MVAGSGWAAWRRGRQTRPRGVWLQRTPGSEGTPRPRRPPPVRLRPASRRPPAPLTQQQGRHLPPPRPPAPRREGHRRQRSSCPCPVPPQAPAAPVSEMTSASKHFLRASQGGRAGPSPPACVGDPGSHKETPTGQAEEGGPSWQLSWRTEAHLPGTASLPATHASLASTVQGWQSVLVGGRAGGAAPPLAAVPGSPATPMPCTLLPTQTSSPEPAPQGPSKDHAVTLGRGLGALWEKQSCPGRGEGQRRPPAPAPHGRGSGAGCPGCPGPPPPGSLAAG